MLDLVEEPFDQFPGAIQMRAAADGLVAISFRLNIRPCSLLALPEDVLDNLEHGARLFDTNLQHFDCNRLFRKIRGYLTEMSRIVPEHGATIDKFIGDAILAFFSDPESNGPREDTIACVGMTVVWQARRLAW